MNIVSTTALIALAAALAVVMLARRVRQRNLALRRHLQGKVPSVNIKAPDIDENKD